MPAVPPGRRAIAITALAGLATATTTLSATADPVSLEADSADQVEQVEAPVPQLNWQPCGDGLDDFLCTTTEVPTDYDHPHGATTTIALTKLPATDPDARIGTLFTNPGGPGGSGVQFVHQMGATAYTDDVRKHFDILGFDPRGVAGSDPVTCYRTAEDEQRALADIPAFPVTEAAERSFVSDNLRLAVRCRVTSRERIEHSSTANVARDMDLLRQAVGDEQLTYIGYSYGSYLGATYARLFPDRVRALAIDGTIVPEDYAGEPGGEDEPITLRMGQDVGGAETFDEFLRLCGEAGPEHCPLAALGDPATVVEKTFERLKSEPGLIEFPDGTTVEVTYQTAVVLTFFSLYNPGDWATQADLLASLAIGKARLSAAEADLLERAMPNAPQRPRRGEDYPSVGGSLASSCVDAGTTGDPFEFAELADTADVEAPHFGRFRTWVALPCEYLRLTDDDAYLGPWDQDVNTPVLVIGTRFDPATPYAGTRPYADHFPDARVLTVEGWGHTVLGKSSCADAVIGEYLVDLAAPADGSTCDQDIRPFRDRVAGTYQLPVLPPRWLVED